MFFEEQREISFIAAAILVSNLVFAVMTTALKKVLILKELFLVIAIHLNHGIREDLLRSTLLIVDGNHIMRTSLQCCFFKFKMPFLGTFWVNFLVRDQILDLIVSL